MIFTRDFVTRENNWHIASLVTLKSLFTVTHALLFMYYSIMPCCKRGNSLSWELEMRKKISSVRDRCQHWWPFWREIFAKSLSSITSNMSASIMSCIALFSTKDLLQRCHWRSSWHIRALKGSRSLIIQNGADRQMWENQHIQPPSHLFLHLSDLIVAGMTYCQIPNISCTLVGSKIVDHSHVVGASPVGAAPTTSSFST